MKDQDDNFDVFHDKHYLKMLDWISANFSDDKEYTDYMAHLLAEFEAKMQFAKRSRQIREDLNLKLP